MGKIELLCLGTGDAETALYDNTPCTAFAVLLDGYPVLLVGAGPGVLRAALHYAHLVPECLLILNATLEQCHELCALVLFETSCKRRIRIFAAKELCAQLGDLLRVQLQQHAIATDLVSFVALPVLAAGENTFFSLVHDFSILLHVTRIGIASPSWASSGPEGAATGPSSVLATSRTVDTSSALLCYRDQPVLALAGPVPFDALLYAKLCQAPFVVVWASQHGGPNRASIYDVAAFSDKVNTSRRQEERVVFLVGGYGAPQDAPLLAGYVVLLHLGSPVVVVASEFVQSPFGSLHLPLMHVRKTMPMKYPISGKTTVLANDAAAAGVGGGDNNSGLFHRASSVNLLGLGISGAAAALGGGGGTTTNLSRRGSVSANPPHPTAGGTPLTAAALQRTGSLRQAAEVLHSGGSSSSGESSSGAGGFLGNGTSSGARATKRVSGERAQNVARWMDPVGALDGSGDAFGGQMRGARSGARDTRKVFVFTNEDKGAPGKLLLLKNFRSAHQLAQRAAQLFCLKPIKDLYTVNGEVVMSLDPLEDGVELIAVRRGGAPYHPQDLPRLLKTSSGFGARR